MSDHGLTLMQSPEYTEYLRHRGDVERYLGKAINAAYGTVEAIKAAKDKPLVRTAATRPDTLTGTEEAYATELHEKLGKALQILKQLPFTTSPETDT